MITTMAQSISAYLQGILSSDDEDASTITVAVDYVPDYKLSDLTDAKVLIVPMDMAFDNMTRGFVSKTYKYEIGILQRLKSEDDISGIIEMVELIATSLKNYNIGNAKCMAVETIQLYNPSDFKTAKKIVSVLRATFKDF